MITDLKTKGERRIKLTISISFLSSTTNPKSNNFDKCFPHAVAVALNDKQIKDHPERISKVSFYKPLQLEGNKLSVTLKVLEKV